MLPHYQNTRDVAASPYDEAAVRAQLHRLLAHPLFTASKRYPALLAYTVEQTLQGNASELKERTVGVGAFSRRPDYDANADPVVRVAAAEVRKRLIQYDYDASHAGELVIELLPGSYVPAFREPGRLGVAAPGPDPPVAAAPAVSDAPEVIGDADRTVTVTRRRVWLRYAAIALVAGLVGVAVGRYRPVPPPSSYDRFWEPFVTSASTVTYCVGEPRRAQQMATSQDAPVRVVGRLVVSDVLTLARTIVPLVPQHRAFRLLPSSETSFAQLREGPVVLIGAFDNVWTLRLTEKLRFGFEIENGVSRLVDRKEPKKVLFEVTPDLTYGTLTADYAIIARIRDEMTGQPVIIVGGVLDRGTAAASEVLYNPVYLDALLAQAPRNWADLNLEAVIKTDVVGGHPGPPSVVAVETW